ncbi:MAG: hypothetical protein ABIL09_02860 [Gemmatimonadota bacterium]
MSGRGRRCAAGLALALAIAGCGLDDGATAECRCTEATDRSTFPHCLEPDQVEASNPLSTRLPECPSGAMLFLREPTDPEAVLFNIRDTFEGFSAVQYMDQLTATFLFAPDLDGVQLYLEVYRPPDGYNPDLDADTLWAREEERRFANNLLDRQRFQRIQFRRWYDASKDQRRLDPEDPRQEAYLFPYEVVFTEQPAPDGTAPVIEVRGRAEVRMVSPSTENPVWSMARWQDFRDEASAKQTFTELRGAFAQ